MLAMGGGQAGGQTRLRGALATAGGCETMPLLELLNGSWGGGSGPVVSAWRALVI